MGEGEGWQKDGGMGCGRGLPGMWMVEGASFGLRGVPGGHAPPIECRGWLVVGGVRPPGGPCGVGLRRWRIGVWCGSLLDGVFGVRSNAGA